jgi:DNA-binding CsgD family transcriptional regulator
MMPGAEAWLMDREDVGLLTRRQAEVVRLVIKGHTTREVAELLFITPETVKSHLRQAFRKCQVRNRVELVRWLLAHSEESREGTAKAVAHTLVVEPAGPPGRGSRKRTGLALVALLAAVAGISLFFATSVLPGPYGASLPSSQAALVVCPAGDPACLPESEGACQPLDVANQPGVYECLAAPSPPP